MFHHRHIIICLALVGILFLGTSAQAQKVMSVQIKESQLRTTPSFLGKVVAKLSYGERVTVLQEKGAWKKVSLSYKNLQGWIHETALTSKSIALRAGKGNVGTSVTGKEIALAGKGFNEEVEAQYKKSNKNLDYTWINQMETMKVSSEQMEDFIVEGSLKLGAEGGNP
jgi:uncharacterized protein YgiM (DUF1202 family)